MIAKKESIKMAFVKNRFRSCAKKKRAQVKCFNHIERVAFHWRSFDIYNVNAIPLVSTAVVAATADESRLQTLRHLGWFIL